MSAKLISINGSIVKLEVTLEIGRSMLTSEENIQQSLNAAGRIATAAALKYLDTASNAQQVQQQWLSQFEELKDPRGLQGQEHAFVSIVMIAILATIGGATGWEDIEVYAQSHQRWLESFLDLTNGIPHADTYRRVFERVNPEALQQ